MKMKLCIEPESKRWVARVPEIPELSASGATHLEALTGVTARALHLLADRIGTGQVGLESLHLVSTGQDELVDLVAAVLQELQDALPPNAETIAAMKELETNGGESCHSIEELFAKLNADD